MGGLKAKRNTLPDSVNTLSKKALKCQSLDRMLEPLVKRIAKLSKGQIRRNLRKFSGRLPEA